MNHSRAKALRVFLPRVTMQEVARAAGVHQTTVSLALRNDPRLPEKTRLEIQAVADRLGYRPDPMLAALNYYRTGRRPVKSPTTMAFLLNFRDREEMETSHPHRLFLEGARRQAERVGYHLEVFYIGHNAPGAGQRIQRVLKARGIGGAIIAAFGDKMIKFKMDWDEFSVVRIESQQLDNSLHLISSYQMEITREAVRHLYDLGYRRIGLAIGEREETYLRNAYTAGYFVEVELHPDVMHLPPLLLPAGASTEEIAPLLARWAKSNDLEVVASNWAEVPEAFRLMGRQVPRDIVVASLDLNPDRGSNAGMRQNHAVVGERAVEQLAILMRTNQRGLGTPHNNTLIEGAWVDGSDVPARPTNSAFISKNKNRSAGL
ncbi:LacI family DNA-binding transcriptional regulator [Oleiharenicola lentus]|uniref:LacI family DNA-binding transcriptional regulator n=1 Tax=Oleiharenicola lentus TaxID=2508720 RepID=UPI003F6690B0